MPEITLADLVRNGTMSPAIAATLVTAASERRSLITIAIPRLAGKTTTMMATLAYAPAGTALHELSEDHGPSLGIPERGDGGYLIMSEIAQTPFPHYLWGDPVRRVFGALERGFSLATALHAPGAREAFEIICRENAVPDAHAARLDLAVYIRTLGDDWRNPTGRRVTTVHEVNGVRDGKPALRLLHRWVELGGRFEDVEPPLRIGAGTAELASRRTEFERVAAERRS
ncbi:MAG: hypothetical protein FJZ92_13515 [Chloroflexi bacterium]|nr:hypothetical protein [Chloroflexota bacterium]